METISDPNNVPMNKADSAGRIALGLFFLLPALFCCFSQLLLPTFNTFLMSFQRIRLLGAENSFVGMENYAFLFGDEGFWQAAGFTFTTLVVRLAVAAVVPLLLAWAAAQFGRSLRLGLRLLLTLPIVLFVPVAIAVTWLLALNPANGLFAGEGSWAADAARARSTLLLIDALYVFGLACGLGLIVFLPLWRRAEDANQRNRPVLTVWVVGLLAVIALTLGNFGLSFMMTNGGPARSTIDLGLLLYGLAFRNFNMGPAAAIASLMLVVILILGLVAGLLVILTRLRIDIVENKPIAEAELQAESSKRSSLAGVLLAGAALLTLGACLFSALPFGWLVPQSFGGDGVRRLFEQAEPGRLLLNSFVPPLVAATLQVLFAYLGALGIGALRPLGKRSEWLLLPFSPWLFISLLPLSLTAFMARQEAGLLDTLTGSISPILFSVPALFILTLFFAGRASTQNTTQAESAASPGFVQKIILPSLPLAGLLWLLLLFANGADLLWPLLVSVSPERANVTVALLRIAGTFGGADSSLAAMVTIFMLPAAVLFFLCLAAFQIFYLDRLAIYTDNR